ncbi:MAG: putative dual-specificity RNA methyltransferase RlmN [Myxococcales bacterium]
MSQDAFARAHVGVTTGPLARPVPRLLGMPMPELRRFLDDVGVGATHAGRVFLALHRRGTALEAIPNLGPRHAATIRAAAHVDEATIEEAVAAPDGTEKLALRLGDARVEAVLIPMRAGRTTLCVSTQAGCAMACAFCATGALGLTRSLHAAEIVAQHHAASAYAAARGAEVTHVVFMGMGEPLHDYPATRDATRILLDKSGPRLDAQRVTVSTVGIVPRIAELATDFGGRVQLAISLHAGTDATRRRLIPVAARWNLASLREACGAWPLPGNRALMLEYVVLPGVNDGPDDLDGLVAFTQGLRCVVNLIPFNPFPSAPFQPPETAEVDRVAATLRAAGLLIKVRWPRGREVVGACGQLGARARA